MPKGIYVTVVDDKAHVSFPDRSKRGTTLADIIRVVPPRDIRIDTGGSLKTYILPIEGARAAGLLDDIEAPVKVDEPAVDETPVKPKRAPRKAAPKVEEAVSDDNAN